MFDVINEKYKNNLSLKEMESKFKMESSTLKNLERRTLHRLSQNKNIKRYSNDWVSLAYQQVGIDRFRSTRMSSTEVAAFNKMDNNIL